MSASSSAPAGSEVTLQGIMMCDASCVPKPAKDDEKTVVLFAVSGTPQVAAAVDSILKDNWPDETLGADQARKVQDEWIKGLKYYVAPGELTKDTAAKCRWYNPETAITGTISEKDGKKWITPSKIAEMRPGSLKYPEKMLKPDKPLAMPGKTPLTLKVADTLSLKCILLPAGKYFAGIPFYATYAGGNETDRARYDDDYPNMVTLTKPFYLAEMPVTQEMYEAVMGSNPSDTKGPQLQATRVSATDIGKFCQSLSEKNKRVVRPPTQAEWEYAARVGTSNPPFNFKHKDEISKVADQVKSKKPNAWGFYDMICVESWEMIRDARTMYRTDLVDPYRPDKSDKEHNAMGRAFCSFVATREGVGDGSQPGYTLTRFRVAVEATPEEIAEIEKAVK